MRHIKHIEALRGQAIQDDPESPHMLGGIHDADDDPAEQDDHLNHIRVDHRRHTADHIVDDRHSADDQDRQPQWNAQADREHNSGGVDHDTGSKSPAEQKHPADQIADRGVEAVLEVFINADQFQLAEQRHQEDHHCNDREGHRHLILQPGKPAPRFEGDEGRLGDKTDRRGLGGHGGDADRPPGQPPPADEIVFLILLIFSQVNA